MSEAIENAAAVCCFITSKYQSSPYCKKELLYAQDCKIPLIPCLMDADPTWRPTEWLGYAVIDILYIDCRDLLTNKTPENLEAKCERLIHRIHMAVDPTVLGSFTLVTSRRMIRAFSFSFFKLKSSTNKRNLIQSFLTRIPRPHHLHKSLFYRRQLAPQVIKRRKLKVNRMRAPLTKGTLHIR